MPTTFALHHISDAGALPFSAANYSRFKFGDGRLAAAFGHALGRAFAAQHGRALLAEEQVVYVPSPYDAIPTASFAMAEAFKDALNWFRFSHGKASLLGSKIHRYKTYTADYGMMSHEERLSLISSDTYHLDKHFLEGRMVIFLDDIRITGSHETIIRRQLKREGIAGRFYFAYYALLDNAEIAPHFENYLNYYEVDSIEKIAALFNEPYFAMNTRVIKYILKGKAADAQYLLKHAPPARLSELIAYAIGNNYHLIDDYATNLTTIIQATGYGY